MKEIDEALEDSGPWGSTGYDATGYDEDFENGWVPERDPSYRPGFATLTPEGRILEVTMEDWAKVLSTPRRIAHSNISGVVVSTVFVGVNFGLTAPLWFETMVFGGALDQFCDRYETLDDAIIGHDLIVTTIKEALRDEMNARSKSKVERVRRHNVVR